MSSEVLLHQLYQTTRIITKGLNRKLEPLGLYTSEWSIILLLKEHGSLTQGGLASHLNIEPPAITNSLAKLEKKGFIERKPGKDKREKNVFLTEKSHEQYTKWAEVINNHRKMIFKDLPAEKQKELYNLISLIYFNALKYDNLG